MAWVIPDNEFNLKEMLDQLVRKVETLSLGRNDIVLELYKLAVSIVEKEEKENEQRKDKV